MEIASTPSGLTGVASAIAQAKTVAGDRHVNLVGSAVPQQCLRAGLLDEIQVHRGSVRLGSGVRLFDHLGTEQVDLETIPVVASPGVPYLRFRVIN